VWIPELDGGASIASEIANSGVYCTPLFGLIFYTAAIILVPRGEETIKEEKSAMEGVKLF